MSSRIFVIEYFAFVVYCCSAKNFPLFSASVNYYKLILFGVFLCESSYFVCMYVYIQNVYVTVVGLNDGKYRGKWLKSMTLSISLQCRFMYFLFHYIQVGGGVGTTKDCESGTLYTRMYEELVSCKISARKSIFSLYLHC